jgi:hypothetical protein
LLVWLCCYVHFLLVWLCCCFCCQSFPWINQHWKILTREIVSYYRFFNTVPGTYQDFCKENFKCFKSVGSYDCILVLFQFLLTYTHTYTPTQCM